MYFSFSAGCVAREIETVQTTDVAEIKGKSVKDARSRQPLDGGLNGINFCIYNYSNDMHSYCKVETKICQKWKCLQVTMTDYGVQQSRD